jgi:5-methylcytosine-specific restriction endonuclease McrA
MNIAPTGRFQKGEHYNLGTEFKVGQEPWNKGIVYEKILGEKHPNWKGGKPNCLDCNKQLSGYTQKRCISCFHKSPEYITTMSRVYANRRGKTGHRKGVKLSEEARAKLSLALKGRTAWNKGKRTGKPAWNRRGSDPITPQSKLERARFRIELQCKIFTRDNYTCQLCSQYGGYLQVDHIKPWAKYPKLRFIESNCRTLCMACHYSVTFKRKIPEGIIWGHNFSRRIA